jgi:hypothetical protein
MILLVWLAMCVVILTVFGVIVSAPAAIVGLGLVIFGVACIVHAVRMMRR